MRIIQEISCTRSRIHDVVLSSCDQELRASTNLRAQVTHMERSKRVRNYYKGSCSISRAREGFYRMRSLPVVYQLPAWRINWRPFLSKPLRPPARVPQGGSKYFSGVVQASGYWQVNLSAYIARNVLLSLVKDSLSWRVCLRGHAKPQLNFNERWTTFWAA